MVNSNVCFHNLINTVSYIEADLSARSSFLRLSPALYHRGNFMQQLTVYVNSFTTLLIKQRLPVKASCILLYNLPLRAGLGQSLVSPISKAMPKM